MPPRNLAKIEMIKRTSHLAPRRELTFILNPIANGLPLPYEVIPDWYLRRATEEEGERIMRFAFSSGLSHMRLYDYGEQVGKSYRSPEPSNWKFFGLDHSSLAGSNRLELAGNLLEHDIALGPSFGWIPTDSGGRGETVGVSNDGAKIAQFFANYHQRESPVEMTAQSIDEWRRIESKLQSLPQAELKPFQDLEILRGVPRTTPLFTLGLFAAIESVITHNPHDQFDSLRHQVSTKMVLLSKRFTRELLYKQFGCAPEILWKKLYDYRSCIAHGSSASFSTGGLAVLKDAEIANRFLKSALKLLLLQLLEEPALINDLKLC